MTTSGKERQQKFRDKQKSKGKKPVTVMLPAELKELIDKEKERTGETITSIIEKAVTRLLDPAPISKGSDVIQTKKQAVYSDPAMKKLYALIKTLESSGGTPGNIAQLLNNSNQKHPDKDADWEAEDVEEILWEIREFMPTIHFDVP